MGKPIKGNNVTLWQTSPVDGQDYPFACARNVSIDTTLEVKEVTNTFSSSFREYKEDMQSWRVDFEGLLNVDGSKFTYANILQQQKIGSTITIKFVVDQGPDGLYIFEGQCLITTARILGGFNDIASSTVQMQGTGEYQLGTLDPGPGRICVGAYTAIGGEVEFTPSYSPSWTSGFEAFYVSRGIVDGLQVISVGVPTGNEVFVRPADGVVFVSADQPLVAGEFVRVLAQ